MNPICLAAMTLLVSGFVALRGAEEVVVNMLWFPIYHFQTTPVSNQESI